MGRSFRSRVLTLVLCFQLATAGGAPFASHAHAQQPASPDQQRINQIKRPAIEEDADPTLVEEMRGTWSHVQEFAAAHTEVLTYGLSSVTIAFSTFLAWWFSSAGNIRTAALAQLAAARAVQNTPEWQALSRETDSLHRTILRYEQGLRAADDTAFKEWAKTVDGKYARHARNLRKIPPAPGSLLPADLFKPAEGSARPAVDFERLHAELDERLRTTHEAAKKLQTRAAQAGIKLRDLKSPQQIMQQGARLARRIASPTKILAEVNQFKAPVDFAEANALRLMGRDLVLRRGVRHWPGNTWRISKHVLWKARYVLLIAGTAGFVYYLHRRQNAKDQAELLAAQVPELLRMDAVALANTAITYKSDALLLMIRYQWEQLRRQYGEDFDYPCPFSFRNKGHQDLVETLFAHTTKVVSEEYREPLFDGHGQMTVAVYREFWKHVFSAARELSNDFRQGPSLESLLGENLDGKDGLTAALALRSADTFEQAMKKIDSLHGIVGTLQAIASIEDQKRKLAEILADTRRLVGEGKIDPSLKLTEEDLKVLESELGLDDPSTE